jgi:hypothetical protein
MRFGRKNKFRAVAVIVGGIRFPSKAEAARFQQLKIEERAGYIRNLRAHERFPIMVNGVKICSYEADAVYERLTDGCWTRVVEDTKGTRTPVYVLKCKLMCAVHGVIVQEVLSGRKGFRIRPAL